MNKLMDIGLLDPLFLVPVCMKQISEFLKVEDQKLDHLPQTVQVRLLVNFIKWSQEKKSSIITKHIQTHQKIGEIKVETPYEARQREQKQQEAQERGEPIDANEGLPKNKTPEEVQHEREALLEASRKEYVQSYGREGILIGDVEQQMSEIKKEHGSKPMVDQLWNQILLQTAKYRHSPALHGGSKVDDEIYKFLN